MATINKIKNKSKSILSGIKKSVVDFTKDPSVSGRKKNTFDYFVEEVGQARNKFIKKTDPVRKFFTPTFNNQQEAMGQGLLKVGDDQYIDLFGIGASKSIGKNVGKLLKEASNRGLSKASLNRIMSLSEKSISPNTKLKTVSDGLGDYLRKQESFVKNEALKRARAINDEALKYLGKADDTYNPFEVIKIKQRGDGSIKIRRGELDIMQNMDDLKPAIGERYFQNPIRVFEELGTGAKELFYRPVKVAESVAVKSKKFWNSQFDETIKGLNNKSSKRIMKYALSREEDGAKILKELNEKAEPLSAVEQKAYNFIRWRYNRLLGQLNEARAMVGKDPIRKRKNYITHIRDLNLLEQMGFNSVSDDIETLLVNKVHRNTTAFGFAKRRKGYADIEMDAFNVFRKYQETAIDHIKLTPAIGKVRELSRTIIFDPKTGQKFKLQEAKPIAFKYIQEWADFVAGQKPPVQMPKFVEKLISSLNRNVAFATLSFNIRSAVIQPSAIINTITEIGTKNTVRGIKELLFGGGDFALKNSKVLEGRQFDTAIKDIANGLVGKTSGAKKRLGEIGLKPLQILDNITAQSTWLGAYSRAKTKLGYVGQEAFNYADDVVIKTQASAARSDIAKIQRSAGGKIATLFQTFVINDFNRLVKDVAGIGVKNMSNAQRVKKAATYLTAVSLWNYVSEDVLGLPTPLPRPIKALKEEGFSGAGKELASQVPIVGGALRYGSTPFGAVGDIIGESFKKVNGKYTTQSWWEIMGKLLGIPGTSQLKKTIKAIDGIGNGYTITFYRRDRDGNFVIDRKSGKKKTGKLEIKITDPIDKIRGLLFGLYATKEATKIRETGRREPRK